MGEEESPLGEDLTNRLHAMESKLRRMRDQRNAHNESARRAADSRDSVQNQGAELRKAIKERMEEQKDTRALAKIHQARRDEIQKHVRELTSRKKGRRGDGPSKSVVIQLSETVSEIDRIENQIMTDGSLSLDKENRMIKKLRSLMARRDELIPSVEEHQLITIDLGDMDESIQRLRAEADNEHQLMIEKNKLADEIWEEIKPMLEERDFLRGEGDRLHSIFVKEREKADEVHASTVEMQTKVTEIRKELKSQYEERERMVREHNDSVRQALKTPDLDDDLADSLSEQLIESGSITFGGTVAEQSSGEPARRRKRKSSRKLGTARGRKS
tara:strand:+ start:8049 stop:9035 length:987 start_codon:yes stop_codon:yes gene_type:complete